MFVDKDSVTRLTVGVLFDKTTLCVTESYNRPASQVRNTIQPI